MAQWHNGTGNGTGTRLVVVLQSVGCCCCCCCLLLLLLLLLLLCTLNPSCCEDTSPCVFLLFWCWVLLLFGLLWVPAVGVSWEWVPTAMPSRSIPERFAWVGANCHAECRVTSAKGLIVGFGINWNNQFGTGFPWSVLVGCCFAVFWFGVCGCLPVSSCTLLHRRVVLVVVVVGVVGYPLKMTTSGWLHCKAQRTGVHGYQTGRWLLWPVKLWGMPCIPIPLF